MQRTIHTLLLGLSVVGIMHTSHGAGQAAVSQRDLTCKDAGNIVCVTIPKAGSHMLIKCLNLFNINGVTLDYNKWQEKSPTKHSFIDPLPRYFIERMERKSSTNQRLFWYGHQHHTQEFATYLEKNTFKCFFLLRDPRDQIISAARFLNRDKAQGFETQLKQAITGTKQKNYRRPDEIKPVLDLLFIEGVCDFYKLYLPWMLANKFYTVRFENLVGEKGGGSLALQLQEIKNIAAHLEITRNDEEILKVAQDLFGGTLTFREGKIGGWKQYFTPEIKKMFKDTPGANQLLIDLGYEKDGNW